MVASGVGPGEHGEKSGIWIINVLAAVPRQIRGDAEGAVPSPDGSLIAFRNSTGTSNLSIVDPSGEHVRVLATASLREGFGKLQWSPDGKQIAVLVRYVGETTANIEAFNVADGTRSVLARQEHLRTFVWLPDGRLIMAAQPSETSSSLLYEIDTAGKKRQLEVDAGVAIADISATADSKRLAIVRSSEQSDVYAATFRGSALTEPIRVTLDERDDHATGWLPDGKTVLFESTRNGTLDVFRQPLDAPVGEQIAAGPDQQYGAEVAPDGATILYWSTPGNGASARLLGVPMGGGAATPVLEAPPGSQFHCPAPARSKASRCVLLSGDGLRFELFDWRNGQREPLPHVPPSPAGATPLWALSCDGARIATADAAGLHVVELSGGRESSLPPTVFPGAIAGVAFSCGSQDLLVATSATRQNILSSVRESRLQRLWSSPRPISSPIVSPDGRRLVFDVRATSSNAWLLENF